MVIVKLSTMTKLPNCSRNLLRNKWIRKQSMYTQCSIALLQGRVKSCLWNGKWIEADAIMSE